MNAKAFFNYMLVLYRYRGMCVYVSFRKMECDFKDVSFLSAVGGCYERF